MQTHADERGHTHMFAEGGTLQTLDLWPKEGETGAKQKTTASKKGTIGAVVQLMIRAVPSNVVMC